MMLVAVCFVTLSVCTDLRTGKIPNALNLAGLSAGLALSYGRAGPTGLLYDLRSAVGVFAVAYLLYLVRALRGGDVKMLCALSSIVGLRTGFQILLYSLFIAAGIGVVVLLRKHCRYGQRTGIPYSVPTLLATLLAYAVLIW